MDRWPSSCILSCIALTVLACVSFLAFCSKDSDEGSFLRYNKRPSPPVARRVNDAGFTQFSNLFITPSSSSVDLAVPSTTSSDSSSSASLSSTSSSSSSSSSVLQSSTSISSVVSSTVISSTSSTFSSSRITHSSSSSQSSIRSSISTPSSRTTSIASSTTTVSKSPIATSTSLFVAVITPTIPTSVDVPSSETAVNVSAAANSSNNFWQKKGAVAATFAIVSLVAVAIIAVLFVVYLKRRSIRREQLLHEEMFEKYSDPGSPDPSISTTPMDPFTSREIIYDRTAPFRSYAPPSRNQSSRLSHPAQHPDYESPSLHITPIQPVKPSSALRNPAGRGSYQPSIDSFYDVTQS